MDHLTNSYLNTIVSKPSSYNLSNIIRNLLYVLCILLATGLKAQSQLPQPPTGLANQLISYTKDFRNKKMTAPGVIVRIVSPGNWEWSFADGLSDVANLVPANPDMVFRTASISKLFCAAAVLKLVSEDRLALNDPVSKWFDEAFVNRIVDGHKITVLDLLRHTSGLFEPQLVGSSRGGSFQHEILANPTKNYADTMLTIISKMSGPTLGYGQYFYSNANFILLAEIVNRVTGSTYGHYLKHNILQPLNLNNTYSDSLPVVNSLLGYIPLNGITRGDFVDGTLTEYSQANVSWGIGSADISSTTEDLIRFYQMLQSGEIIPQVLAEQMVTDAFQYGLGTMMFRRDGATYAVGHAGIGACYSNILCKLVHSNVYISFSFNSNMFITGQRNMQDYLYGLHTIIETEQGELSLSQD